MKTPNEASSPVGSLLRIRRLLKIDANIDRLLACYVCHKKRFKPVTGPCGHTRCIECCTESEYCSCGEKHFATNNTDILLQRLIEKRDTEKHDRRVILTALRKYTRRSPTNCK